MAIRFTITYTRWFGPLVRRILMPRWQRTFERTFSDAVDAFEYERGTGLER